MKKTIILISVMALTINCHAESILLTGNSEAEDALAGNAPEEYANSGVPKFLILGKQGKFYFGAGGKVQTTIGADFGHPISTPDEFITSSIPIGPIDGNGSDFHVSARQTAFFMNLVALPGDKNQVGAFVGINLVSDDYSPVLEYAYLRWRGLEAGYDYTLFSDPVSNPGGIDYQGPPAICATGSTGIRYGYSFGKGKRWNVAIGVEMPRASYTNAEISGKQITYTVSQRVPDIPLAIKYSWAPGSHVRLAGILRNIYSRNVLEDKNIDHVGWGVHLSTVAEIVPGLTAYASGVYGRGISSFIQDLEDKGMDLVPTEDGRGLRAMKTWGAYVALQYDFNEHFSIIGDYSHVHNYPGDYKGGSTPWWRQYSHAQYVSGTLTYNINSYLSTGIEYIWGQLSDCNGHETSNNRVQASIQFNF